MKVSIDHTLCEGHGKCMETVPEVFEVRDDDRAYTLIDTIPAELEERVRRAEKVCPRAAIKLQET